MNKLILAFLFLNFSLSAVFCCLCVPMTPLQQYCVANTVVKAKITGEKSAQLVTEYDVDILEVIKSPNLPSSVKILTPSQDGICGVALEKNSTYILTANYLEPNLHISSCGYHVNLDKATEEEKKAALDPLKPSLDCSRPAARPPNVPAGSG
ncbi:metalloproteinase inhibitor 2-like protein [Dinothrombium tinctorium]|uniref:Metalloproteinase inhibitor 2-like protein n=1 Tax=Dinothrombium tinctorium TaxID=1965070 RepID=A0A3S3NGY4_9ACAR|nr:metalloproteinase inhibitor 2-like protein [Dinothrombium tinctorium]RWS02479.1 metalloproteinase inhibitor 2-like protein [Dinothrombium tinctorium]RWS02642.1 metalloproteinase inhibitor 2-like protein [Dinothrombium tinctorium]